MQIHVNVETVHRTLFTSILACEQQTHFGGREATTGNASAVRRLRAYACFSLIDLVGTEIASPADILGGASRVPYPW